MTWAEYEEEKYWCPTSYRIVIMATCWILQNDPESRIEAKGYFGGCLMGLW